MSEFACYLEREAILALRGRDIPHFLQGQLTADMRLLSPAQAVAGALCNVKGRVLSDVCVVLIDEDCCLIRLRDSLAAECAQILQRYAQFSRIAVTVETAPRSLAACYTQDALSACPATALSPLRVERSGALLTLHRSEHCREVLCLDGATGTAIESLIDERLPGAESDWRAAMLRLGHFAIEPDSSAVFTPQALNYDRNGLVAFDKGCYTGQEVVARLHYKGKSKKRLAILLAPRGSEAPAPDTPLLDSDGEGRARVLRAEGSPDPGVVIAAEVAADDRGVALRLPGGEDLQWLQVPA